MLRQICKLFTLRAPAEANGRPGGKRHKWTVCFRIGRAHGPSKGLNKSYVWKENSNVDRLKWLCSKILPRSQIVNSMIAEQNFEPYKVPEEISKDSMKERLTRVQERQECDQRVLIRWGGHVNPRGVNCIFSHHKHVSLGAECGLKLNWKDAWGDQWGSRWCQKASNTPKMEPKKS